MAEREYSFKITASADSIKSAFAAANEASKEFVAGVKEGFGQGLRDAVVKGTAQVEKFGDETQKTATKAISSFDSIALKITGLVAGLDLAGKAMSAIGGAIAGVFEGINRGGELNDLSQRLGVAVETLSSLELGAASAGVSVEGMATGIQQLSRNMVEAASGSKEAQAGFAALGISVTDSGGRLKSTEEILLAISDRFAGAEDGAAKTGLAMQLLGRSGAQLIPFLNEGAEGLRKWQQISADLGLNLTGDLARAMDTVGDAVGIFGAAITGAQNQLAIGMSPALASAAEQLVVFVRDIGIADGTLQNIGASIGEFVSGAVETLIDAFERLSERARDVGWGQAIIDELSRIATEAEPIARDMGVKIGGWIAEGVKAGFDVDWTALLTGALELSPTLAIFENIGSAVSAAFANAFSFGPAQSMMTQGADVLAASMESARAAAEALASSEASAAARSTDAGEAYTSAGGKVAFYGAAAQQAAERSGALGDVARRTGAALPIIGKGADDAAKAAAKFAEATANASAALNATTAIYGRVIDGTLSFAEAEQRAAAASAALSKGLSSETAIQGALAVERQKATAALTQSVASMQGGIDLAEQRVEILGEQIAAGASAEEAERALSLAMIDHEAAVQLLKTGSADLVEQYRQGAIEALGWAEAEKQRKAVLQAGDETQKLQLELSLTQQVNQGLITQLDKKIALARAQADGNEQLAETLEKNVRIREAIEDQETAYIHLGDVFRDSFSQAFDAVIDGTRDMGDVLEGIALGIGKRFFTAMLDSKLKDFDPTVKANFLDLGEFGKSVFGDLFSGSSSGSSAEGSSDGLLSGVVDWIKGLFGGGSSSGSGGGALEIIGQNADGSYIYSDGSEGYGQSIPGGGSSSGGGFSGAGALAGAGAGYASSSYFGQTLIGDTNLPKLLKQVNEEALSSLRGINEVIATVLGAVLGGLSGGGGAGGGIVGSIVGIFTSLVGDTWSNRIDRDALRDRGFGAFGGMGPAGFDSGSWDVVGATDPLASWVMWQLLGLPTLGTAYRRAGEGIIDESTVFGGEDGKGGLQALLGDFTRSGASNQRGPEIALERGLTQAQVDAIVGGTGSIFSQLAEGELPEDAGRFAEAMGRTMAEFLSRGLAEGMDYDDMMASLAAFAAETGTTALSSVKNLNAQLEQSKAAGIEFGKLDPTAAATQGAEAYAASLYGISEVFSSTLPLGVNIAQLALQTMEKDGVKAFESLDHTGQETLTNLTKDAELFQDVVTHLVEQGFTIDTEEFETRLEAITESAQFLGENFGSFFQFENVGVGVQAVMENLKTTVLGTYQEIASKQLFEGTNFAAAFEPVFAALNRIEEFDLTTATGSQGFMDLLLPALAQGKANLQEYIPILQLMADNWKEIEKIIDEAMEPDVFEKAGIAAEAAFQNLGGVLNDAITAGIAVLENGGTWDQAVSVFNSTFGSGITASFKEAVFNAIVDQAFLQPLIATYQPAFAYVWSAGMIHGFSDPKVKEAMGTLLADLQSDAEKLGLVIFEARVDSDGVTSDIEKAFNDAADITVDWANDLRGQIRSALNEAFDAGSAEAALASWGDSMEGATRDSVLRGIVLALIDAAIIEPFIKEWAPIIQYWATGAMTAGLTDPKVIAAGHELFGPDSEFMRDLNNIGPVSIDIYGRLVGWTDETDGGPTDTTGRGGSGRTFPGAARGGMFGHGESFIVGEAGPELVLTDASGSTVIPLSWDAANAMLDGGMPGYANGRTGPRGGGGPSGPVGRGPVNSGPSDPRVNPPSTTGPGLGAPITSPLDPRHPDYVDPRDKPAAGEDEVDVLVRFNFDSALEEFARGGTAEDLKEALKTASGEGLLEGMMNAVVESLAFEEFNQKLSDATREAMKDGVIDAAEAAELGEVAKEFAAGAEASILAMGPAFDVVAEAFGLKTEEEVLDALAIASAAAGDLIGSSLRSALRDPANLTFETFSLSLRQAVYGNIVDGLVDAFIDAGVIQGALAPMLAVITAEFGNLGIAIAAGSAEGIAAASAIILAEIGKIAGIIDDPAFKAAIQSLLDLGKGIADGLGLSIKNTTDTIDNTTDSFNSAADAAANACTGECDLEQKLVTTDEKIATLDSYGRTGGISDRYYEDVKRATGTSDSDSTDFDDGDDQYGFTGSDADWRRSQRWQRRDRRDDGDPGYYGSLAASSRAQSNDSGTKDLAAAFDRMATALKNQPLHAQVVMNDDVLIDAWTTAKRVADKAGIPFGG